MLVPTYNNPFGLRLLLSRLGSPEITVTKSWLMVPHIQGLRSATTIPSSGLPLCLQSIIKVQFSLVPMLSTLFLFLCGIMESCTGEVNLDGRKDGRQEQEKDKDLLHHFSDHNLPSLSLSLCLPRVTISITLPFAIWLNAAIKF
ncbi:hypothetical protein V8G54_016099 [Vigna mungo]|uniref:Uncharacterized protein n=1 Tax=Vigna mungo TaxID=3915 RepID=A0AAQ3S113_VIGMU